MVSNRSHWFSSPYYSCCCCRHNLLFIHLFIPPAQEYYRFNFLGGSDGNESACNARDLGLIPGSGRSPGEGKGYPLKHSCLKNHMDGGNWRATVYGVAKSQTQLSNFHFHFSLGKIMLKSANLSENYKFLRQTDFICLLKVEQQGYLF